MFTVDIIMRLTKGNAFHMIGQKITKNCLKSFVYVFEATPGSLKNLIRYVRSNTVLMDFVYFCSFNSFNLRDGSKLWTYIRSLCASAVIRQSWRHWYVWNGIAYSSMIALLRSEGWVSIPIFGDTAEKAPCEAGHAKTSVYAVLDFLVSWRKNIRIELRRHVWPLT